MNKRIERLTELTLKGEMYVKPVKTEFDRMDMFLSKTEKDVKRICEYILNQEPKLTDYSKFTGFFHFDGSVVGDLFNRSGHKHTDELLEKFYVKHIDNISSMDWQHGTSDYREILDIGITGILNKIDKSIKNHTEKEKNDFLIGLKEIAKTLILWMEKCSARCADFSKSVSDTKYKENLKNLSQALLTISKKAPETFYEAVLTIYVTFSLNPDSFGTLDRYLFKFYEKDIKSGILTREKAKEYLQELFLMVQAATLIESSNFTKGGQSHFCIGGRDENGKDIYSEMSQLIVESLMELPTYIPQLSLRWTNDTPKEVLSYLLMCERTDKNKRIAFTNDDKRIEAYTKICGFPYEEAINYTLVGCNEPAMLGGMCASSSHANLVKPLETVLYSQRNEIINSESFDEFYKIFKSRLYNDLDIMYYYDDLYNLKRGMDKNYVSCLTMNGCIENGKSATQGGVNYAVSTVMFLGNVTVIDSLSIIKQFVFDEKKVSIEELLNALSLNWKGYEELHANILKNGDFFGNDTDSSNYVASLFYNDLYEYLKNKKTAYDYPVLLGDHTGYQLHFKWFGENTKATPDGRFMGEPLSYGISQSLSKARNGLSALMNSISKFDKHGISSATVTNFTLDESFVSNDEYFEKTVILLETYLKNGGMQFQLNFTDKDELIKAKNNPNDYKNLRVRVTGYSDYFTRLHESIQDSIIQRFED